MQQTATQRIILGRVCKYWFTSEGFCP